MSEDKKELNENELDKVNGGGGVPAPATINLPGTPSTRGYATTLTELPCNGGNSCVGSSCRKYDSCTYSIKK